MIPTAPLAWNSPLRELGVLRPLTWLKLQSASENYENFSTHEPEPVADTVIQRNKSELIVAV